MHLLLFGLELSLSQAKFVVFMFGNDDSEQNNASVLSRSVTSPEPSVGFSVPAVSVWEISGSRWSQRPPLPSLPRNTRQGKAQLNH